MHSASSVASGFDTLLSSLPAIFAVVGEHRANPDRLLLLGDDGRFYTYATDDVDVVPIDLTPDWVVDAAA